jgi:hypothetical protein
MISDKSNIPKDENMRIFIIIPLEHQWAHPYYKSVKEVWDNVLVNKDMISWMQIGLRKINLHCVHLKGRFLVWAILWILRWMRTRVISSMWWNKDCIWREISEFWEYDFHCVVWQLFIFSFEWVKFQLNFGENYSISS